MATVKTADKGPMYLEVKGPVPKSQSFPPPVAIAPGKKGRIKKSGHKLISMEIVKNSEPHPVPFMDVAAMAEDSPEFAYKVLRFEAGRMIDSGVNPEPATLRDLAEKAAARSGIPFGDLLRFIAGPVAAVRGSKEFVKVFAHLNPAEYSEPVEVSEPAPKSVIDSEAIGGALLDSAYRDYLAAVEAGLEESAVKDTVRGIAARYGMAVRDLAQYIIDTRKAEGVPPAPVKKTAAQKSRRAFRIKAIFAKLYREFAEAVARGDDPDPAVWIMEAAEAAGVDAGKLATYIIERAEEDPALEAMNPDRQPDPDPAPEDDRAGLGAYTMADAVGAGDREMVAA